MHFPSLSDIPVTTMVVIVGFSPTITIDVLFPLLEMSQFKTIVKNSKKVSLPLLKAGSILSARYKGVVLGNVHFSHPRFFKNAITVDISTSKKNVNIKISNSNLQMCGIKNMAMVDESTQLIFSHIRKAAEFLTLLKEEHLDLALNYVKTKDESILKDCQTEIISRLLYFATKCTELKQFEDMIDNLRSAITKPFLNAELSCVQVRKAMVNYNFSLGFKINRGELARRVNGINDFTARYDNTLDYSVCIEHPHEASTTRKKGSAHVTFTIYRSGILAISGPNSEIIEPIYEKFIKIIEEIRPFVEQHY